MPLSGSGWIAFAGERHAVARSDVFTEKPAVAYLPPRTPYSVAAGAHGALEVAIGGTPATGQLSGPAVRARRAADRSPEAVRMSVAASPRRSTRRSRRSASSPTRSSPRVATGRASRPIAMTAGSGRHITRRRTTTASHRPTASRSSGSTPRHGSRRRDRRPAMATSSSSTRAITRSRPRPGRTPIT